MNQPTTEILVQSIAHAKEQFPEEAVGIVYKGRYVRLKNVSKTPEKSFETDPKALAKYKGYSAVIHSHPEGERAPSKADIENQIVTAVPWHVNVMRNGDYFETFSFGDFTLDEPLVGRNWRSGVYDCVSLTRAYFWQKHGIKLPDLPRYDGWWDKEDTLAMFARHRDQYAMFELAPRDSIRAGDLLMMAIRTEQPNHFGIMYTDQIVLHHPAEGLSARRPFGTLQATVKKVLRLRGGAK